ncbi:MAG: MFS transporter [Clostridia bacterium]|nr:MFS transporter [Clostridia bacterium]
MFFSVFHIDGQGKMMYNNSVGGLPKRGNIMQETFGKKNWFILLLFGMIGQIAWSVENMYFNLFVYEEIAPSLSMITLMVQLSGVMATVATLVAGTWSDKVGNRRSFISWGYAIWGVTVALFGCLSQKTTQNLTGVNFEVAVSITLTAAIVGDCIMTLFSSTANDAAFNAWVTDNTEKEYRGKVEGIISILPLAAMLVVAGGFGMLVSAIGYKALFIALGVVISACGVVGIFTVKDSPALLKNGSFKDIFYGFKPSVIRSNTPFYYTLLVVLVYGIACQIFMPYLIIYMKTYLGFSVLEYSAVFAIAIIAGAALNVYLTKLSDKKDKVKMLYLAAAIFAVGLLGMYLANFKNKTADLIVFGIAGFVMITGYILVAALSGAQVRDYTPQGSVGKLQGVRMVFSVLIPMLVGPLIGNAINAAQGNKLSDLSSPDVMTTEYIPAPEIFLAAAICTLLVFAVLPLLSRAIKKKTQSEEINETQNEL